MCVCVCVCDISSLRVNGPSEPGRLRDVCVCQWVNECLLQNDERCSHVTQHTTSLFLCKARSV